MKIERSLYLGIPAAVLAGLILFTYFSYRDDIVAAEARVSSGSQVVDTPCGPIEYALAGKGTPVLLVHGAGGGFDQGLEFGRPLAEHGFTVIAMSRFGYLRTPMPADASPAAQAEAHACLLDALKLPGAAILGGSAGAPSTVEFCLRHAARCSAMVLLVPAFFPPAATQARSAIPTRGLLLVAARDPFGDKNRLRLAFPLDGHVPRHLHASVDVLDGSQPEVRAHARAGGQGPREAHAVQAVVDPQTRPLNLDRLLHQMRQQGQREKAVRDGRSVRRFPGRALAVDVDPLVIFGRAGKGVDALLAHAEPIGHRDLLADELSQLFDAAVDLGHVLEAPRMPCG